MRFIDRLRSFLVRVNEEPPPVEPTATITIQKNGAIRVTPIVKERGPYGT